MDAGAADRRLVGDPDEEEDDDDDDEDDDDEYDYSGTGDDAVDRAQGAAGAASPDRSSRRKRACWPPPAIQQNHQPPRGPVWSPLFRLQPPGAPAAPAGPGTSAAGPGARTPPPPPRLAAGLNPVYGYRMRLYCRTGFHLSIGPRGRVAGTANPNDKYAVLEFSSVNNGEVRIRGVEANLFLAMNRQGKLYGQTNVRQEGTVFVEMMLGQYNTYLSRKFAHVGWYVAIKKNGKHKPGNKTAWGQKSIQFLPIRV